MFPPKSQNGINADGDVSFCLFIMCTGWLTVAKTKKGNHKVKSINDKKLNIFGCESSPISRNLRLSLVS